MTNEVAEQHEFQLVGSCARWRVSDELVNFVLQISL